MITNLQQESSLQTWYPKIKDLLPTPRTVVLELAPDHAEEVMGLLDGKMVSDALHAKILESARQIGYPLFMRTDQGSGKHDWKNTCYVESEDKVLGHIAALVDWQLMRFLPAPAALVFRELLPLIAPFKAFDGEMPIAKERRYFVEEGEIQCGHPYWPAGAIEKPSDPDWEKKLAQINKDSLEDVNTCIHMAKIFSQAVPGFWSVDFAQDKSDKWWMIDAARGELSYHPPHQGDDEA